MRVFVLGVSLLLLAACGRTDDDGALITDLSIDQGGVERVYDVYAPEGSEGPAALVVLLHGQRGSKEDLEGRSRAASPYKEWQRIARDNDLVLLIPQGATGTNGHAGWNDCRTDASGNPTVDDVGFISEALDAVRVRWSADEAPVFVVGTSNGGHMAQRLAHELSDPVAGFAVIAAGAPANSVCVTSSAPISAMFIWGTDDPFAPHEGGPMVGSRGEILSAELSIEAWVTRNGTDVEPSIIDYPDLDSDDGSSVRKLEYRGGQDGSAVALLRVDGGGHTEPSIAAHYRPLFERVAGTQNHDIESADEVWAFFASLDVL